MAAKVRKIDREELEAILSCIPVRKVDHEVADDGKAKLLVPRFQWKPLQRLMVRLGKPHIRVVLDELGSFVWLQADGAASVRDIVTKVEEKFGDRAQNSDQRTAIFFKDLVHGDLITLMRKTQTAAIKEEAAKS